MEDLGPWLSATLEHLKQKWRVHLPAVGIVFGVVMGVGLISMFIMFVLMFVGGSMGALLADQTGEDLAGAGFSLGAMLLGYGALVVGLLVIQSVLMGYSRFVLLLYRGEQPGLGELGWSLRRLPRVALLMLVQSVLLVVAVMFCYLPVFIVLAGLFFAWPVMVDRDIGAIAAIKASWALARPRIVQLIVLVFLLTILTMVVVHIPLVGLAAIFAVRVTLQVVVYEDLRQRDAA